MLVGLEKLEKHRICFYLLALLGTLRNVNIFFLVKKLEYYTFFIAQYTQQAQASVRNPLKWNAEGDERHNDVPPRQLSRL